MPGIADLLAYIIQIYGSIIILWNRFSIKSPKESIIRDKAQSQQQKIVYLLFIIWILHPTPMCVWVFPTHHHAILWHHLNVLELYIKKSRRLQIGRKFMGPMHSEAKQSEVGVEFEAKQCLLQNQARRKTKGCVAFFWLVGGEVTGQCSRNLVLNLKLSSSTRVGA